MHTKSLIVLMPLLVVHVLLYSCGSANDEVYRVKERFFVTGPAELTATYLQLDPLQNLNEATQQLLEKFYHRNDVRAVKLNKRVQHSFNFNLTSYDFALQVDQLPVCDSQIEINDVNGQRHMFAHIPANLGHVTSFEQASDNTIKDLIAGHLGLSVDALRYDVMEQSSCYHADDSGNLSRAVVTILNFQNLGYKAVATPMELLSFQPYYLAVDGEAEVFATNPLGSLKTFTLEGLSDKGTLENSFFQTAPAHDKAVAPDFKFNYNQDDPHFNEASLFVHANEQLKFFNSLGYKWSAKQRLTLVPGALVNGSPNNALYAFGTVNSGAKILVGDGDGRKLEHLAKDRDVVAHEFGHHVLFDTLQEPYGETVVLHEGLADFFADAHDDNACLAESICPDSSTICEIKSSCLRSAENSYVLNKNTKSGDHEKSQFLSGMLWDLRADIDHAVLTQLVFDATRILLRKSGYRDFILALLVVDEDSHKGAYCKAIMDGAMARGLKPYMQDIECGKPLPSFSAASFEENHDSADQGSKKKSRGMPMPSCGTIVGTPTMTPNLIFLVLLLTPLFILSLRPRQRTSQLANS